MGTLLIGRGDWACRLGCHVEGWWLHNYSYFRVSNLFQLSVGHLSGFLFVKIPSNYFLCTCNSVRLIVCTFFCCCCWGGGGVKASATTRVISRRWNDDDEISFLVEETVVPGGTTDIRQVTDETFHTNGLCPVRGLNLGRSGVKQSDLKRRAPATVRHCRQFRQKYWIGDYGLAVGENFGALFFSSIHSHFHIIVVATIILCSPDICVYPPPSRKDENSSQRKPNHPVDSTPSSSYWDNISAGGGRKKSFFSRSCFFMAT